MKKVKNKEEHFYKMCFSKVYRREQRLKKGRKVWDKLDKKLPAATGSEIMDDERLEKFKTFAFMLPSGDKDAMKEWLKHELYGLEHHFNEFATYREEKNECRLKQIYREHLSALS